MYACDICGEKAGHYNYFPVCRECGATACWDHIYNVIEDEDRMRGYCRDCWMDQMLGPDDPEEDLDESVSDVDFS